MKKIIFISKNPQQYNVQRLQTECLKSFGQHQVQCIHIDPQNMAWNNDESLEYSSDIIFFRSTSSGFDDLDLHLLEFIPAAQKINNPQSCALLRQKDRALMFFSQSKIKTLPFILWRGNPQELWAKEQKTLFAWEEEYGAHWIYQSVRGQKGLGTTLIRGRDALQAQLDLFWALKDQRFILKPFLDHKIEWRLFFTKLGARHLIKKWQKDQSDFRHNAHYGSHQLYTPWNEAPSSLQKHFEEIIQLSNLDYGAIESFAWQDHLFLNEVNAIPGFESLEQLTGLNIAQTIVQLVEC